MRQAACDTEVFLDEAAESMTPTRKRNIPVLDDASRHKGRKPDRHFLEPRYLPPYSPDFNPIERIRLITKAEYFANSH